MTGLFKGKPIDYHNPEQCREVIEYLSKCQQSATDASRVYLSGELAFLDVWRTHGPITDVRFDDELSEATQ